MIRPRNPPFQSYRSSQVVRRIFRQLILVIDHEEILTQRLSHQPTLNLNCNVTTVILCISILQLPNKSMGMGIR
jgi:hypothetical protein